MKFSHLGATAASQPVIVAFPPKCSWQIPFPSLPLRKSTPSQISLLPLPPAQISRGPQMPTLPSLRSYRLYVLPWLLCRSFLCKQASLSTVAPAKVGFCSSLPSNGNHWWAPGCHAILCTATQTQTPGCSGQETSPFLYDTLPWKAANRLSWAPKSNTIWGDSSSDDLRAHY